MLVCAAAIGRERFKIQSEVAKRTLDTTPGNSIDIAICLIRRNETFSVLEIVSRFTATILLILFCENV